MTTSIDTSPAALRKLAEPHTYLNACGDRVNVCDTKTGHLICGFDMHELLAIAAEKEAQAKQEPVEGSIEAAYWRFDARRKGYGHWKETPMSERDAFKTEIRNAIFAQQHHPEQHIEMVAPADVPRPETTLAEVRNDKTSERELSDHGSAYYGSNWYMVRKLYTAEQLHQYAEAYAKAAVAAERERICAAIKSADDLAVSETNYMLDSNDCIKVIRGTWAQKGTT